MNKTISIIPYAGLCNRIRAIVSGINIAKKLDANCVIYWNKTRGCYCNFSDLFEKPALSNVSVVENRDLTHYHISRKRNLYLPKLIQKVIYDFRLYNFNWDSGEKDIFKIIPQKSKKILLCTCHQMYNLKGIKGGGNFNSYKKVTKTYQ